MGLQSRKVNDTFITKPQDVRKLLYIMFEQGAGGGGATCVARGRGFQPRFDRKLIFFFSFELKELGLKVHHHV